MASKPTQWSKVPHGFVTHHTYTGQGCAMCGKPENDPIHVRRTEGPQECQTPSLDYGSYGYPCHLPLGHDGPHEVLDKDDFPHHWGGPR